MHAAAPSKLHLCAEKDACSNRIVGYSIGDRVTSALAVAALGNELTVRGSVDTIVHSEPRQPGRALLRHLHSDGGRLLGRGVHGSYCIPRGTRRTV
jgi:hypothetical protein